MWLFLSSRLRSWLLFALVLPVAGRLLEVLGVRVAGRSPRAGQALSRAGAYARTPAARRLRGLRGRRR